LTEENKRHNIAQELERAEEALKAARVLADNRCYNDAVSRAYYGALHFARALMLIEGLEAKTHAGVAHLVNMHFVKSGRLDPKVSLYLGELQAVRSEADYDAAAVFTEQTARDRIDKAREYGAAIHAILQRADYA